MEELVVPFWDSALKTCRARSEVGSGPAMAFIYTGSGQRMLAPKYMREHTYKETTGHNSSVCTTDHLHVRGIYKMLTFRRTENRADEREDEVLDTDVKHQEDKKLYL
jgi:phage-related protein